MNQAIPSNSRPQQKTDKYFFNHYHCCTLSWRCKCRHRFWQFCLLFVLKYKVHTHSDTHTLKLANCWGHNKWGILLPQLSNIFSSMLAALTAGSISHVSTVWTLQEKSSSSWLNPAFSCGSFKLVANATTGWLVLKDGAKMGFVSRSAKLCSILCSMGKSGQAESSLKWCFRWILPVSGTEGTNCSIYWQTIARWGPWGSISAS